LMFIVIVLGILLKQWKTDWDNQKF
jgi:hypothetical protein